MIVRMIAQLCRETGEKHVTVTQDTVTPTQEFLILSPGWEDSEVIEGQVLLLGLDAQGEIGLTLLDEELHSALTQHTNDLLQNRVTSAILAQLQEVQNAI
jgi:hypothetical protein